MKTTDFPSAFVSRCSGWQAFLLAFLVTVLAGCVAGVREDEQAGAGGEAARGSPDQFMPVDCLLPPQVRKLGSQMTYLATRRPVKTTARDCEIRGGEYVAYDRADYRTALQAWLEPARQGDPEAQTYVGEIYEKGLGLPADYQLAFVWYSRAAEQGYPRAQINLGYLYEKGLGVKQNQLEALNWYRRASGIEDEGLDYASNVEVRAATLAEERTEVLREEIRRREHQVAELAETVDRMQARLDSREQSLKAAERELARLEHALAKSKANDERLAELKAAWEEQKQRIAQTQASVVALQQQMLRTQALVARQNENLGTQRQMLAMNDAAGPAIEVFEPVVVITRGGGPLVRIGAEATRTVRGRISAPAGLRQASINDRPLQVDDEGIFVTRLAVDDETPVAIVATDRRDRTTRFEFVMRRAEGMRSAGGDTKRVGKVAGDIDFGRYFALVIGNDSYPEFPHLATAVNDARQVARVLGDRYGFETRLLVNADRYQILSAFNDLREQLTAQDNLLIYYAGHGERDPETLQGYWLPVDAEADNTANWIANATISDLINTLKARHVLVVADSCYSGAMTRSSVARIDARLDDSHLKKWLSVMARTPSRTVLTSGGVSPVLDDGGDGHSVFARAFLQELTSGEGVLDAYRIYLGVTEEVAERSARLGLPQRPTYAPIRHTGHGGGEFLFVARSG